MALLFSAPSKPRSAGRDKRPVRPERNRKLDRTRKAPPEKFDPLEPIQAPEEVSPGDVGAVSVWIRGYFST